jgi:exosortase
VAKEPVELNLFVWNRDKEEPRLKIGPRAQARTEIGKIEPERSSWARVALLTPVFTLILAALYASIVPALAAQWWADANYSHGFLVPLFSGFLVWRQRARLRALAPRGSMLGLPVLVGGISLLVLGDLGAENFLMRSSLIVILAGLVLFHLGPRVFRIVLFPLSFLLFMVPLPGVVFYAVTFPLQRLAAEQAAWVLDLLGVPVLLDGNVIHLSQISLGVTEACSGIRSLISLLAAAVAGAYLLLPSGWAMAVLVASAVPITILANVGRVVSTGLIGQWFGVEYAAGFFHEFAGLVVYLFAVGCLVGVHSLIRLTRRQGSKV